MRLGWAIAAGVLGGAAFAWWMTPSASRWNPFPDDPGAAPGDAVASPVAGAAPELYRWRDAHGVLHVAQQPPGDGQAYERVVIPQDRNVIPMGEPARDD